MEDCDAAMEDWFAITLQIHLLKIYFIRSTCEIQLKKKSHGFNVLGTSLLGLKQFLIWVFLLLVMVNFIFRGTSVISTIPAN